MRAAAIAVAALALAGAAGAQERPKVVSTFPPHGATVPAGVDLLQVTYDRPMAASWSFATGGEHAFPELAGNPSLSADRRTISLPIKLRPESTYVVWLNTERYNNFKDEKGQSAEPYRLTFSTSY